MNLQAVSVGIICLVGSAVLLLLEKTTPKGERVSTRIWFSQSHESVRISIILLVIMGLVLLTLGLILS